VKHLDYTTSYVRDFYVTYTNNVVIFNHLELWREPRVFTFQQAASVGYIEIHTPDARGHLETRDRIVLVGDGALKVTFPGDCLITWQQVSMYHLATNYHEAPDAWTICKRVPRHYAQHR